MRLDKLIEEAMEGARSLKQAENNLFRLLGGEASGQARDNEYFVNAYAVAPHYRRRPIREVSTKKKKRS